MRSYGVRDDRERIAFNPAHLDDYPLDPYEFRIYMRFVRRGGNSEGKVYEAVASAAKACRMSERKVRYAIKALCALGLVRLVEERRDNPSVYAITASSHWVAPEKVSEVRKKALQPDPEKRPMHKGAAPDAVLSPARPANPPAPNAAHPLHDLQTPPAPDADKGTPLKVSPYEGTPSKDSPPTPPQEPLRLSPRERPGGSSNLLQGEHPQVFVLLCKLKSIAKADDAQFHAWTERVLTDCRLKNADTVRAALEEMTLSWGNLSLPWKYYAKQLSTSTTQKASENVPRAAPRFARGDHARTPDGAERVIWDICANGMVVFEDDSLPVHLRRLEPVMAAVA